MEPNSASPSSASTPPPVPAAGPPAPAWGGPPTPEQLPDEHIVRKRITLIVLIFLTVIAIAIAVTVLVPWNQGVSGQPIDNSISLDQINAAAHEIDGLMDDVDANMAAIDPSLTDAQGDLSE